MIKMFTRRLATRSVAAAGAALAAVLTFGPEAWAFCGGGCPGGCEEDATQNLTRQCDQNGNNCFYIAPPWKDYNSPGVFDQGTGTFAESGFDTGNNEGTITISPFASEVSCADAGGWQDGALVSGCFVECDTGNFGDGGNCTTVSIESAACLNPDTGFGPPSNFLLESIQCFCG